MQLRFHNKALEMLGINARVSADETRRVDAFESRWNVTLPAAMREWYTLENCYALLEEISFIHAAVKLEQVPKIQAAYTAEFSIVEPIPILVENEGVWHMGAKMLEGDDPPVHQRFNEQDEIWKLHAHSFSDWIRAFAWDSTLDWNRDFIFLGNSYDMSKFEVAGYQPIGPETFVGNAYFFGERFVRVAKGGQRLTIICPVRSL